jgi:hypothetical protein
VTWFVSVGDLTAVTREVSDFRGISSYCLHLQGQLIPVAYYKIIRRQIPEDSIIHDIICLKQEN